MSTAVAKREAAKQLVAQIRDPRFEEQLALALPEGVTPKKFVRVAATALLENPELAEADPDSVFASLLKAAADGLLPDSREAALVIYSPRQGPKKAQYLPMIGGLRKIAAEHGWAIQAECVYEADDFRYVLGERPAVHHAPAPLGQARGKIVAAYAIGRELATGALLLEVMRAEDIAKVRGKAKTDAIWKEWEDRMTEKTVGRRLFKALPLGGDRVRRILAADPETPEEARALVYGSEPEGQPAASPAPQAEPSGADDPAEEPPGASAGDAPFDGAEPPEQQEAPAPPTPELEAARSFVLPEAFTRYAGRTLGSVEEEGDRNYVAWLASAAVKDEEVRAAARVLLDEMPAAD